MTCENRIKVLEDIVCRRNFVHTVLHSAVLEMLTIFSSSAKIMLFRQCVMNCTVWLGYIMNCTVWFGYIMNCTVWFGYIMNCTVWFGYIISQRVDSNIFHSQLKIIL